MKAEIDALKANKTWSIIDLPLGKTPIGCKWVYKLEFNQMVILKATKHALLLRDILKLKEIDYHDTYSTIVKMIIVHLHIAVTIAKNWYLDQLNVNNAFPYGDLNKKVYMTLPQGLHVEKPNQVCRLMKSLYGLKQASR